LAGRLAVVFSSPTVLAALAELTLFPTGFPEMNLFPNRGKFGQNRDLLGQIVRPFLDGILAQIRHSLLSGMPVFCQAQQYQVAVSLTRIGDFQLDQICDRLVCLEIDEKIIRFE